MTAEIQLRLPTWPPKRLVTEAVLAWNLRHRAKLDPRTSSWPRVYAAILSFCRHSLTSYDEQLSLLERDLITAGHKDLAERHFRERNRLREKIHSAARLQYRWLRPDIDPRPSWVAEPTKKQSRRILDDVSRERCEAIERRALILGMLRRPEMRRNPTGKAQAEQMLAELDQHIAKLGAMFEFGIPEDPRFAGLRFLVWNANGTYRFACRTDLPENYLRETASACPNCGRRIIKTKRGLAVGAGVWLVCYSCTCTSVGVTPEHDCERAMLKIWPDLIAEGDESQT